MAEITLQFNYPINESCQAGDIAYYQNTANQGGYTVSQPNVEPVEIGVIKKIENIDNTNDGNFNLTELTCEISVSTIPPNTWSSFIFFSKDRRVNESAILGYYGEAKFENNSREKAELFSATCEATGNSK